MAEKNSQKLKFKIIYIGDQKQKPRLLPQGYRLATVEECRKNLDIFKKIGLPVEEAGPSFQDRRLLARVLDGYMEVYDHNFRVFDVFDMKFIFHEWIVAVKKRQWDIDVKKWRNCSDFYSPKGISLRRELYDGITLHSADGIKFAWRNAFCYEDVELLYWLLSKYRYPFDSGYFNRVIASDISFPLGKTLGRLASLGLGAQLQMEYPDEEVRSILSYAKRAEGTCDWGVAFLEFCIELYGSVFIETAAAMTSTIVESVPIFTKLLSLSLEELESQIPSIEPGRFTEILIEAVERGYSPLVEKMFDVRRIDQITEAQRLRALRAAVRAEYIEMVGSLLQSGEGGQLPVEVDDRGKTLYHYALFHPQIIQLLPERYADKYVTTQDKFRENFLHWAAKGTCDPDAVDHLLGYISSSNRLTLFQQRDNSGRTPLHIAASKGYSGMIEKLLEYSQHEGATNYIQETDSSGLTALQMAAGEGHEDSVKVLLKKGSQPLKERDGQRKTALHHAALVKDPNAALSTCKALLENGPLSSDTRSLLLWASATGIGTADEMENVDSDVKDYLQNEKKECTEHLLRAAAVNEYPEMAWELLNRGANMADILDRDWRESLDPSQEESVETVISHMDRMKEQGRDQPSIEDNLGRHVFAEGVAALLLNRFIESPITVGISGEWGMGKSSLMIQIEKILLITAAQLTFPNLLPREEFVGAQKISLNTRGRKTYQQINRGVSILLKAQKMSSTIRSKKIYQQIGRGIRNLLPLPKDKLEDPLVTLLTEYQSQNHAVYKSLACMDNNQMLQSKSLSQQHLHALREVPRILTIRYNAWHYRDRHEAWAGLGVTITREIENAMTRAQWMSTCWRYTWTKKKVNIWIHVFLPSLLSIFLAGWVAWIVWMLLKQAKFQGLKYGSIPSTVIAIAWVVLRSVISVVKPVSTQMLAYITSPDHTSHLGYQEDVIADINFLKNELGNKPHWFFSFILGVWCWNWFGLYDDVIENTKIPKFMPASGDRIRIVTFVDDLDRCEEEVILQVLSAVNLVLAECKINVILGTDKKMIARAIRRKFEDVDDEDIAEKFICKVIQIPLSLPNPTGEETKSFLKYHLAHEIPAKYMKKENVIGSPRGIYLLGGEPLRNRKQREISTRREEHATTCCPNTVLNIDCREPERRCRGIITSAIDWLGRLFQFAFTIACNISSELRQPYDESSYPLRSAEGVKLIRELLMPNYSEEEANIFYALSDFALGIQILPREWKRLLSYHKFAWYVLFRIGRVHSLPTWKEELIGWIFVCWQWHREMNHLIKNWDKYRASLKSRQNNEGNQSHCRGPLLGEIVGEYMKQLRPSQSPESEESNTASGQEAMMRLRRSLRHDPSMTTMLCLYKDTERVSEGTSQQNWSKLQKALEIRDVSMEAVQLFQQFRFYCDTDHLEISI